MKTKKRILLCVVLGLCLCAAIFVLVFRGVYSCVSDFAEVYKTQMQERQAQWDELVPDEYLRAEEHFRGGFQDYTDFCVYCYEKSDLFETNPHYQQVTSDDVEMIKGYFSDFQQCLDGDARISKYTFNPRCISPGDYYVIQTKEGRTIGDGTYDQYDDYSVWYFDVETLTLYYIHQNI